MLAADVWYNGATNCQQFLFWSSWYFFIFILRKQKYEMFDLKLPAYDYKIRSVNGKNEIFDFLRHKFVALTPEEWVRQHFTHYLINEKAYPAGRTVQEAFVPYNGRKKRCDTVIY